MKAISILNQKGGCGKTSLSVLTSLALASSGKKVLAVDCDPQGGLSAFLTGTNDETPGLFDLLTGMKTVEESIITVSRDNISFDLIRADYRLDSIASNADPYSMKRQFKTIDKYDFILFDNPPTVQGISRATSLFADEVFIPADVSMATLGPTLYTINALKDIEKKGKVVLVGYKEPKEEASGYMAEISRKFMEAINGYFAGNIPKTVTTARAISDPTIKWSETKVDKLLSPILEILGVN